MAAGQRRTGQWTGNLPETDSSLVGREAELAEAAGLLGRSRLVTLTGVGGVGKTRLALRVAEELRPSFADGAWWVELSPVSGASDVLPYAIAEALPLADASHRSILEVLADYLAAREVLLVLDTCEHLVEECREVVSALLTAAPGLRVLATSRRPLGLYAAEEVLTLDPLPVPEAAATEADEAAAAASSAAVALLTDRAAAAVPGFAVTDANRAAVLRLCRRLEGLPLALELAAARLRELPVAELNDRLDDRYETLDLDAADSAEYEADPPWHRALRTAIGWSHQLCTPAERLLWARLSVFAGSFDAGTAAEVCADGHLPGERIPGLLASLVDKSILTWVPMGSDERYRMLDTLREYGAHWLRGLGELEVLRRRHLNHYLRLAAEGDAAWIGPDQFAWYDRMTAEHDNVRAALERALAGPGARDALDLVGSLWFFWHGCGLPQEGRHYMDRALAADPEAAPGPSRVKALFACGQTLLVLGDSAAIEARAAECTALAAPLGERERTLAVVTEIRAAALRGDATRIVTLAEGLLATPWRERPITYVPLITLVMSAHAHMTAGRLEQAIAMVDELTTVCERHGELFLRSWGELTRAHAEMARGRFHAAIGPARSALRVKHRMRDGVGSGMALDVLAQAAAAAGQGERAALLLGLSQALWDTLGRPQAGVPVLQSARKACETRTQSLLGPDSYRAAFDRGCATPLPTGIAYALAPDSPPPTAPR